ncbi:nudix hydrolase 2 isoform X1 [Euphorbia lathyris]|uniref:nudix hydrolase 2 isoform X1 n=1 Tax=Euphorbia lathyris TaxID=212925 RepID=UPI003313109A
MEQNGVENDVQQIKILAAVNDEHEGVIVELKDPMNPHVFASMLKASILHWTKQGKRGIWIKVPIELVHLVEASVKEGFWYHHAEPKYLMLAYWIPEGTHTLPANASHRVGIGAFVMNEKREVLVVQEKSGIFRGSGVWKFPTGVVDEGEDLCAAAVREVKEETNVSNCYAACKSIKDQNHNYNITLKVSFSLQQIDAKFVEVLAFRQSHKAFFEKSDLFFLCLLQPMSFDIQKQESEIEAAQWTPLEEYVAQPFVQKNELLKQIVDICLTTINKKYSGFSAVPISSNPWEENNYLYFNRDYQKKQ